MRARIIFRGLTLFTFTKPSEGASPDADLGTLTAWLVSDPKHAGHALHAHKPRWGLIGRDHGDKTSPGRMENRMDMPPLTRIELAGHGETGGVIADSSFLSYIPALNDLYGKPSRSQDEVLKSLQSSDYVVARVEIPRGRIRARDFVTWEWHGKTAARVGFMDTSLDGFLSNEVVVDIGDDSDVDDHDDAKFLSITHGAKAQKLWARTKTASDHDLDPNVVEIEIKNLPARRARAVPWGLHIFTSFEAAGYQRRAAYANVDQFNAFQSVATQYDADQWRDDADAMGIGFPFPFLIDPTSDKHNPIKPGTKAPMAVLPPNPPGRKAGEGPKGHGHGGHGGHGHGHGTGHDPENTEICPFTRT